jgi:aspartate 1-decarboxylase
MVSTFVPFEVEEFESVGPIIQTPGITTNQTSFLEFGDMYNDYVVNGLVPSVPTSSLTITVPSGIAYVQGYRTLVTSTTTLAASAGATTYVDLNYDGSFNAIYGITNGDIPAVSPNSLRLHEVVAGTSISSINPIAQIGAPQFAQLKNGVLNQSVLPPTAQIVAGGGHVMQSSAPVLGYCAGLSGSIGANFSGAVASCLTPSASGSIFNIYQYAAGSSASASVGTLTFAASAYTGTFSSTNGAAISLSIGDTIVVVSPNTVDSALANVSISLSISVNTQQISISGSASTLPPNIPILGMCSSVAVTLPSNAAGSVASCITPATAAATFPVYQYPSGNGAGTLIGSVSFAAGAYQGSFATTGGASTQFNIGDTLIILSPSTQDSTLANVFITVVGQT